MLVRHLDEVAGPLYYIAGPPQMVAAMRNVLNGAGVDDDDVVVFDFVHDPVGESRQRTAPNTVSSELVVVGAVGKRDDSLSHAALEVLRQAIIAFEQV